MLAPWQQIPFESLLAEHGLAGLPEREFPTDGWSGARFSMIERGSDRFVIKRTSPAIDRSMSAFWPVDVDRSAGVTRVAIDR